MYFTEIVDEKQSESDDSEDGGESVGEETEKPEVCLFVFFGYFTLLT